MLYTTVQIRSKSIKTTDLASVIKTLERDTDKGFTEEFNVRRTNTYEYDLIEQLCLVLFYMSN